MKTVKMDEGRDPLFNNIKWIVSKVKKENKSTILFHPVGCAENYVTDWASITKDFGSGDIFSYS